MTTRGRRQQGQRFLMMRRLETFRVKLMLRKVKRRKQQKTTRRMMERMKTMLRSRRRLVGMMKRQRRMLTWINLLTIGFSMKYSQKV